MKKFLMIMPIVLITILISSCSEDSTDPVDTTQKEFFPIATGYSWTYEASSDGNYVKDITYNVISDTTGLSVPGTFYKLPGLLVPGTFQYYGVNEDGVFGFTYNGQEFSPISSYFQLPEVIEVGTIYSAIEGKFTVEVMSIDETVNVPAGSYKCYYYKFERTDIETRHYYISPGTGIVKMEFESAIMGNILFELKSKVF